MNFDFNKIPPESWEVRYQQLEQFDVMNGAYAMISKQYWYGLGQRVADQQKVRKNSNNGKKLFLTVDKVKQLELLHIVWNVQPASVTIPSMDQYQELQTYCQAYGNTLIQFSYRPLGK